MKPDYARRYRTLWERHWWWRAREAMLLDRIDRLHRRGSRRPIRVLDVGCGDGLFFDRLERFGRVEGLEPDASLVRDPRWRSRIRPEPLGDSFRGGADFDLVLMLDVLEHIEDDAAEMARAAEWLRPGGHVVALSPAHQWLFTPFDRAIGHYRRYTRKTLAALTPPGLELVRLGYLDSVGLLASLGNRLLLGRSMPTPRQVATWDTFMVPVSRVVDPALGFAVGKSVLGVWRHPAAV